MSKWQDFKESVKQELNKSEQLEDDYQASLNDIENAKARVAQRFERMQQSNQGQAMKDLSNKTEAKHSFTVSHPVVNLDKDVILSNCTRVQLDEGIAKLKFHKTIYEDWNFGSVDRQGRSVILNFFGAPGTGKTLTAEAFAGSLGMPIIKVSIAELESKFMGETSKNIQAVFEAAIAENAVLFFDEADTLLGKRLSSVTQGIDNEVNAMRSTLLIELEKFNGIAIFATNFAKNYDEAFRSRISHHIEFELPDLQARKQIWSNMIVEQIPLADEREQLLDVVAEQSEGLSGREIRTCMRLVLPKILLEAERAGEEPKLKTAQLIEVIGKVKLAQAKVGTSVSPSSKSSIKATQSLLGVNKESVNAESKQEQN